MKPRRRKSKVKITEFTIPKETFDKMQNALSQNSSKYGGYSSKYYENLMKRYIGRFCMICESIPSKKVSYNIGDACLIQFYCSDCFEKEKDRL